MFVFVAKSTCARAEKARPGTTLSVRAESREIAGKIYRRRLIKYMLYCDKWSYGENMMYIERIYYVNRIYYLHLSCQNFKRRNIFEVTKSLI